MNDRDFTLTFTVPQSPEEVFAAVADVRGWWSASLEGRSATVGDELTYRHGDLHRSVHRVIDAVPGERMVWRTLDAELRHARQPGEWIGTEVRFELTREAGGTRLRFTHVGLRPTLDCFEACSRGWTHYVGTSLRERITTGRGRPD